MANDHITYKDIERYYWEVAEPATYVRQLVLGWLTVEDGTRKGTSLLTTNS